MSIEERFDIPFVAQQAYKEKQIQQSYRPVIGVHKWFARRPVSSEQIPGFRQTPDFIIPSPESPVVVIEAKLTEDDGTARDKVARILRLRQSSARGEELELVACIDGRGFSVRQSDIEDLLRGTHGQVFSLTTLPLMVDHTALRQFVDQAGEIP
ncbi:MAG: hypothetical protein JXA37_02480 [Chloroflexia bacterium]|nr:hypothetical protein [Chloroflexia bacterium]